jgi:hypothetical protein
MAVPTWLRGRQIAGMVAGPSSPDGRRAGNACEMCNGAVVAKQEIGAPAVRHFADRRRRVCSGRKVRALALYATGQAVRDVICRALRLLDDRMNSAMCKLCKL